MIYIKKTVSHIEIKLRISARVHWTIDKQNFKCYSSYIRNVLYDHKLGLAQQ